MSYSVVILSKNAENLWHCLCAIERCNRDCSVIVVDDGLAWYPAEYIPGLRIMDGTKWPQFVPGAKPFIFARNANLGIAAAGEDDVILLNDDALLKSRCGFDFLSLVANNAPDYGIISPATSGVGNENQSLYADYTGSEGHRLGMREEPKVLCFVCVYIRRDILNKLGPLDERFIAYGWEDNDYCRRALAAGYKLGIYDPVQVEHGTLKSTFRGFGHCDMTYNQRLYEEKWGVGGKDPRDPQTEVRS